MTDKKIAVVLIGRNEGDRLLAALEALPDDIVRAVYVDSGSTDGSIKAARAAGADVVELDLSRPFTAARARNTGVKHLEAQGDIPDFIQFIDGDCVLQPTWLSAAKTELVTDPTLAVVCGRRREKFPERSSYNAMIDREWDTPIGLAMACGGDALVRYSAFRDQGGYSSDMIAGEEPEMCLRLRQAGWKIKRIDAEMTLHDANITRFSQWWNRARRAGHAYADGAYRHGATPDRHKVPETLRALIWGLVIPLMIILLALIVSPWALTGLFVYPLQVLRLRMKGRPLTDSVFQTVGKFPEVVGILDFCWRHLRGKPRKLIEYK